MALVIVVGTTHQTRQRAWRVINRGSPKNSIARCSRIRFPIIYFSLIRRPETDVAYDMGTLNKTKWSYHIDYMYNQKL